MELFKNAISHNGQRCDVLYEHIDDFGGIPDELIVKAHAVCFSGDKMLLVGHSEWNVWSIPGGTREPGESVEEAMKREVQEETNCRVVESKPISYQKVVTPDGNTHYRLQYLCEVEPLGEFESDPAGNIDQIIWIDPSDYEKYIENREIRSAVLRRAIAVRNLLK